MAVLNGKFEATAIAHIDSIYRFALYMTENENSAQELVKNAYLKLYKSMDTLEEETNYKIRLLRILNNALIPAQLPSDDFTTPLGVLPAVCKAVVVLADIEGLAYKEIADVTGIPVEDVTANLYKGRIMLNKVLQNRKTKNMELLDG